jgi:hypothetical protein
MFDGSMIDVAIGVALLFLVSSLLASAAVEAVGGLLHRRSKNLWDTIDLMLGRATLADQDRRVVDALYCQPFIRTLVQPTRQDKFAEPTVAPGEASVPKRGAPQLRSKSLTPPEQIRRFFGPDHIAARDFANSLIEVVRPGGAAEGSTADLVAGVERLPDGTLKTQLQTIVATAGDRLEDVRSGIETWYERHMTAVSVWYRRQTRWFLFAAGLSLAVALNVDAVQAARTFYQDDQVRAAVVERARSVAQADCEGDPAAQLDCVRAEVGGAVTLPVGWNDALDASAMAWFLRVVGWLVVAVSVTLGAPFWYDLLRRAFSVRQPK